MKFIDVLLIGIALAMDACALTVANCATYATTLNKKKEISMPVAFGVFQFLMPIIGFYIGSLFSGYIANISKYITAGIFFVLSAKIIFDNVREILSDRKIMEVDIKSQKTVKNFTFWALIIQAVATSIDALAVGVTFSVELTFSIFWASLTVGIVTIILAMVALILGKYLGKIFGKYACWLGAVILLALAIKNLVEGITTR